MLAAILPILTIAAQVVPFITDSAAIAKVVQAIMTLAPTVINTVEGGTQAVKNVIKGLKENENLTVEDWEALDEYEAGIDTDWEKAKAQASVKPKETEK